MERRSNARRARRVQVTFWRAGDDHVYNGYTTNFSRSGMFIGTTTPLPRGTRVRIEVNHPEAGFVVEAVVARAVRMPATFQSAGLSGMGVRFVPVDDLVEGLFAGNSQPPAASPQEQPEPAPEPPAAPDRPRPVVFDARGAKAPDAAEPPAPRPPITAPAGPPPAPAGDGVFRVTFRDLDHFAEVLRRDILTGGVFVSTAHPPPVHARIVVEIVPPLTGEKPVRILALVVMRQTAAGPGEAERPAGVGVAFIDPQAAARSLAALAQKVQA